MNEVEQEKVVVRGLENVAAAETRISYVDGVNGQLFYQGYNLHDIAEKVSYEEVVFLLWNAHLPTKDELSTFRSELVAGMRIPSQVVEMIKLTPPTSHPMSILRTAVSMLSIYDPDTEDILSYSFWI